MVTAGRYMSFVSSGHGLSVAGTVVGSRERPLEILDLEGIQLAAWSLWS